MLWKEDLKPYDKIDASKPVTNDPMKFYREDAPEPVNQIDAPKSFDVKFTIQI